MLGKAVLIGLFVILPGGFLGLWIGPTVTYDILGLNPDGGAVGRISDRSVRSCTWSLVT